LRQIYPKTQEETKRALLEHFKLEDYSFNDLSPDVQRSLTKKDGELEHYLEWANDKTTENIKQYWDDLCENVELGFSSERYRLRTRSSSYVAKITANNEQPEAETTNTDGGNRSKAMHPTMWPCDKYSGRELTQAVVINRLLDSHCAREAQDWKLRHFSPFHPVTKDWSNLKNSVAARYFSFEQMLQWGIDPLNDHSVLTDVRLDCKSKGTYTAKISISPGRHEVRRYADAECVSFSPTVCWGSAMALVNEFAKHLEHWAGSNSGYGLQYLLTGTRYISKDRLGHAECLTTFLGWTENSEHMIHVPQCISMELPPNLSQAVLWSIYRQAHIRLGRSVLPAKSTRPEVFERAARLVNFLISKGVVGCNISRPTLAERKQHWNDWKNFACTDWKKYVKKLNRETLELLARERRPDLSLWAVLDRRPAVPPMNARMRRLTALEMERLNGRRDPTWAFTDMRRFTEGSIRAVEMLLGDRKLCAYYRPKSSLAKSSEEERHIRRVIR
jgi:hypothetical protein